MSDILLGVIIGGLIASVTPIVMIILDRKRWERQATLEQLSSVVIGPEYRGIISLAVFILILVFKPQGLFEK